MTEQLAQTEIPPSAGWQAPLRRSDWRFLLPAPNGAARDSLALLGGTIDQADRLEAIGLARRVSRELPPPGSADVVVLQHNARVDIQAAARCLAPGGVLCCEIDRRAPGMLATTPRRMAQALRRAGLESVAIYWAIPDFAPVQRYVPLDAPGALSWYLRTSLAASPPRQLLAASLRALARVGGALALPARCYTVVARAGPAADTRPALLAESALPRELRQPGLRPMLIAGATDDAHRIIMLPFARRARQPATAIKFARLPEFNHDTVSEQAILGWLKARLDPGLAGSVPEPLGLQRHGELIAGVESYLPGRSLSTIVGRWDIPLGRKTAELERVVEWLIAFHQQAQVSVRPWDREQAERWVGQPLADYARLFELGDAEADLFAAARARAAELAGRELPLVWQHHNFGEWNVLRAADSINVIDWEHARAGLPLYDLLHFVVQWSYSARRLRGDADQLRGFRELFCDVSPADRAVLAGRAAIGRYMARLGIDTRFLPLVLVYMSVEKAVAYARAQRAYRSSEGREPARNRSASYVGVLAEHVERLFATTAVDGSCAY